jgi:hypothetical protein
MDPERETSRWGRQLRALLADRGRSLRSVDRQLGWAAGSLARLLRPPVPEIKVRQLLAVLAALGERPAAFLAPLYGPALPAPLARPRDAGASPPPTTPWATPPILTRERIDHRLTPDELAEIERRVAEVVRRELERQRGGAGDRPSEEAAPQGPPAGDGPTHDGSPGDDDKETRGGETPR